MTAGSGRPRGVRRLGDTAVVLDVPDVGTAQRLATVIEAAAIDGVEEVVVGYRSTTVVCDPAVRDPVSVPGELGGIAELHERLDSSSTAPPSRRIEVPVVFDGPDLAEVAASAAMTTDDVVAALTGVDLAVAMVGFVPGFAYLVGLPPALARVGRRPTPRPRVPAGAVAIAGGFAGIYPQATPGGWRILGRSGTALFSTTVAPFALLAPGDQVRLRADTSVPALLERPRPVLRSDAARRLAVLGPGLLTTVQDRGRRGVAALGVPRAGAADPLAAGIANRAVGNADSAALLEIALSGPTLSFSCDAFVAFVGDAELYVGASRVAPGTVQRIGADQIVQVGSLRSGARAYLAIDGGVEIPRLFGSASSDLLSSTGPGALKHGDVLGLGPPGRPRARFAVPPGEARLRVLVGPDPVDGPGPRDDPGPRDGPDTLFGPVHVVSETSDRTGVRLLSPGTPARSAGGAEPKAMVTGAIQLPGDGRPIVLGCDHATLGGYPVVAAVVSADWSRLGQLRAGDEIRLEPVDIKEAALLRVAVEAAAERAVSGWFPTHPA